MSLGLSYDLARSALSTNSALSSIVARNVSNANSEVASRKAAVTATGVQGGKVLTGIINAVSQGLLEQALSGTASAEYRDQITRGLETISSINGDLAGDRSIGSSVSDLNNKLNLSAETPWDVSALNAAVSSAKRLASVLNLGAASIQHLRNAVNDELGTATASLSTLLQEFETVNNQVKVGTAVGSDVTDSIDRRSQLLQGISELVDVKPLVRSGNDVVLYLSDGVPLFESTAREVSFEKDGLLPGVVGSEVRIDGVPMTVSKASLIGGRIGGLLAVRDDVSITASNQIDEIARGLIVAFQETDQASTPTLAAVTGLFAYHGSPAVPSSSALIHGLAGQIVVSQSVDPDRGGDVTRLRDGGISTPSNSAYSYNTSGAVGFNARLFGLSAAMRADQSFALETKLPITRSVMTLAIDQATYVEGVRAESESLRSDAQAQSARAVSAWQSEVGINVDEELMQMMSLERSYQATSRLITTVNTMFDSLLQAVG